ERELDRAKRSQQSLGIIMLDVDHFKRFNDTYGHEAGDIVLRELGKFISSSIFKADIACRYGGEEFILLMPEVSLETVQQRAEQLRSGIKRLNFRYRGQALEEVTLSLGIAMFPEHGMTGEATIAVADRALYRAKKEGRDRVVTAI
ncbi:MAG: GGDEF domain-containing protein, partial [Actinomycetota bacterium]